MKTIQILTIISLFSTFSWADSPAGEISYIILKDKDLKIVYYYQGKEKSLEELKENLNKVAEITTTVSLNLHVSESVDLKELYKHLALLKSLKFKQVTISSSGKENTIYKAQIDLEKFEVIQTVIEEPPVEK